MRLPIGPYIPQSIRSGVGAIEIARKLAVNSSSIIIKVCLAPSRGHYDHTILPYKRRTCCDSCWLASL
jgi:hypothetical protein